MGQEIMNRKAINYCRSCKRMVAFAEPDEASFDVLGVTLLGLWFGVVWRYERHCADCGALVCYAAGENVKGITDPKGGIGRLLKYAKQATGEPVFATQHSDHIFYLVDLPVILTVGDNEGFSELWRETMTIAIPADRLRQADERDESP